VERSKRGLHAGIHAETVRIERTRVLSKEETMKRMLRAALIAGLVAAAPAHAADTKKVAISMIVEVPQLLETKEGVLKGLAERGFVEGKNLAVEYQTANGSMPTQQQIARRFVGSQPDLIISITTPTSQAMAAATKETPIVFVTVIDPVKAKLIPQYQQPGGNVTGVSDRPPIAQQLKLFRELVPNLKRLGFVYNPGLDSSQATLGWIKEQGEALGIEIVESAAPTTNEVIPAARKLVGRVDAIYIPNDTTVVAALESIVKIGQETQTPVFTGETRGVERGALASVGLNYTEVGRLGGHIAAEVLNGRKPGEIDAVIAYEKLPKFVVVVNKGSAAAMGVKVPEPLLARADKVIE
jgi:putative ABC transport system substrate-binding protein